MEKLGNYDASLQMFVQGPREPIPEKLVFWRRQAMMNRVDHKPSGVASGNFVGVVREHFRAVRAANGRPEPARR